MVQPLMVVKKLENNSRVKEHILVQFDLVFKSRADVLKDECYVLFELGAELLHQWSDVADHTLVGVTSILVSPAEILRIWERPSWKPLPKVSQLLSSSIPS